MTDESDSIEIPGWSPDPKRKICGTLLMNLPPDQARAILDRLMDESDDEPSMILVEPDGISESTPESSGSIHRPASGKDGITDPGGDARGFSAFRRSPPRFSDLD